MSDEPRAQFLRRLAQNDYMIDGRYLPDGERLLALAEDEEGEQVRKRPSIATLGIRIMTLKAENERLRAALRAVLGDAAAFDLEGGLQPITLQTIEQVRAALAQSPSGDEAANQQATAAARALRSQRYKLVVVQWRQTTDVARELGVTAGTVLASVRREFKERHPEAWEKLEKLMRPQPWDTSDTSTPHLWMLRLYEHYGAIPTSKGSEGWSRCDRKSLLRTFLRYGVRTTRDRASPGAR